MHCFNLELSTLHLKVSIHSDGFLFHFFYQCYHCSYCNRIFISFPFAGQGSWNQATWTWTNRRIKLSWQFSRMIYSLFSMLWRETTDTKMNVLVITTGFSVFKSTCEFRMQTPTYAFDSVNYFLNWWNLGGFTGGLNVHLPKSIIFLWIQIIFFSMSWTITS